ncbi:MAG: histidinol-phosphate transaminase [Deltaproteobacteria bacterium]|nr:histidinol-phosphate transaminase [Deltaproteobacteria bacterium]
MATRPNDTSPAQTARALVRPEIARIEGYVPGEQPRGDGFIKLNTNENPYPPSERVRKAIVEACDRLVLYPDPTAREVREIAARLYDLDADGVVVGNGSDELLSILVRAVVGPGEGVAYPVPTYSLYDTLVALHDARSVRVPFPTDFSLPEELERADARLFFICNPNAPSGTVVPIERIDALALARPDAVIVVDEAYADFADRNALALVRRRPNVVVLRTLSKAYSLAGLRVGLALASAELAYELHKVRDSYNVSRLAQAGALAALEDQAAMRRHAERVRTTRARLTKELERLGFQVLPSQANFILARRPGEDLSGVAGALRERKILVRHFREVPDSLRITVGTDAEIDALLAGLRDS